METKQIVIGNMQSAHCQMNVSNAIQKLEGVKIIKMTPGLVEVQPTEKYDLAAISEVILSAGYRVDAVKDVSEHHEETNQYKTNINCAGCVQEVTDALNSIEGVCHWEVDTASATKTLSVHFTNDAEKELIEAVQEKGFRIEKM